MQLEKKSMSTDCCFRVWICRVSRMYTFHAACFHGNDTTGNSPESSSTCDDSLSPVIQRLNERTFIEETMFKLSTTWRWKGSRGEREGEYL